MTAANSDMVSNECRMRKCVEEEVKISVFPHRNDLFTHLFYVLFVLVAISDDCLHEWPAIPTNDPNM